MEKGHVQSWYIPYAQVNYEQMEARDFLKKAEEAKNEGDINKATKLYHKAKTWILT